MKVVYLAGPYRASTEHGVAQNIHRAGELALRVWQMGAACICPHKNTAFFGGAADDRVWLDGDLELMRRCDAVLCTPDWRTSKGALDEIAEARRLGIPVFETPDELERWLADSSSHTSMREPAQAQR